MPDADIHDVVDANITYKERMIGNLEVRETRPGDVAGIERLYADAFPEEDLVPLVRGLLDLGQSVVSLVGIGDGAILGHIIFTLCHVRETKDRVALLGPLAVSPAVHGQGIGRRLVQGGFERMKNAKIAHVLVLGDPAFYGRFGFAAEDQVTTPYPLPTEWYGAWQSVRLNGCDTYPEGVLSVPGPWRQKALWSS